MGMLEKLVIEKVLKVILKKFKLDKLVDYMEKPNAADIGVAELMVRVKKLEDSKCKCKEESKVDYKKILKYKGE